MELFGKIKDGFLVVKNPTVLPHNPRKIEYLKKILKVTLKKRKVSLRLKEKFIFTIIQGYIYPAVKHPGQRTVTTRK